MSSSIQSIDAAVGAIVLEWGRIESAVNDTLGRFPNTRIEELTDLEKTPSHAFRKRLKMWRALNIEGGKPGRIKEVEALYRDLLAARLDRDVIVHGPCWSSVECLECSVTTSNEKLLRDHYKQIVAIIDRSGWQKLYPQLSAILDKKSARPTYTPSDLEARLVQLRVLYTRLSQIFTALIKEGLDHPRGKKTR